MRLMVVGRDKGKASREETHTAVLYPSALQNLGLGGDDTGVDQSLAKEQNKEQPPVAEYRNNGGHRVKISQGTEDENGQPMQQDNLP